jgi:CRP-like cAMP-binding protein
MSEKRSNPPERTESPREALSKGIEGIKAGLAAAPVFAFLEKFDVFAKKKTRVLAEGETLFEPGEDPYFYIVTSGALKIFRINPSGEKKEIGKAYTGSFLGEGALSGRPVKEVEAVAYVQSSVAAFTKEDFDFLESKSPETLMRFYRHLSDLTSLRLADSGKELALLYEMTEKINACKEKGERGTLEAITLLKQSLSLDYIIMVEQHSAVPGLLVYKYNTRFPSIWPINQKVGAELNPSDSGLLSHPEAIL